MFMFICCFFFKFTIPVLYLSLHAKKIITRTEKNIGQQILSYEGLYAQVDLRQKNTFTWCGIINERTLFYHFNQMPNQCHHLIFCFARSSVLYYLSIYGNNNTWHLPYPKVQTVYSHYNLHSSWTNTNFYICVCRVKLSAD